MSKLINVGSYQLHHYYQHKNSGYFFKIIDIPNMTSLKIESIHSHRTYLLTFDEFEKKMVQVNFAFLGVLKRKMINEINAVLKENEETLKSLS